MPITDISNGIKNCSKCGESKTLDNFYKLLNRGKRIPYSSSCKDCRLLFQKNKNEEYKKPCPECGVKIARCSEYCRSCYHKSEKGLDNHNKISEFNKRKKKLHFCVDCGVSIYRQSKRCMKCKSKGVNNSNWKEGASSLKKRIMSSFEYRQWRSDVFKRDDYTCLECGIRGVYLHAHHIVRFSSIVDKYGINTIEQAIDCSELWDINNGSTLCVCCHNNLHKKEGYFYV